ncbi:29766_t:CDS:1, partial [Racocetra persica]
EPPTISMPCWTFISKGMSIYGQKEICFTLLRSEDEKETDFPIQ